MDNFTKDKKIKKVLILTCSTGAGHNSAAKAIAESFSARGIFCEIFDHLNLKNPQNGKRVGNFYANVIVNTPSLFGLAYTAGVLYDKLPLPSPVYAANLKYARKLFNFVQKGQFDCIICTHLFAMAAMTAVRRKYPMLATCYAVLTDYVATPFIKDLSPDGWFVPNAEVKSRLTEREIYGGDIYCTGIPVSRKFAKTISKAEARKKLGIPQDTKLIAVLCGGAGCGKIAPLCKQFLKKLNGNFKIWVFTGNNKKLKRALDKKFGFNGNIQTVGFVNDINLRLKAADIALSKTGGLSSTEIAVSGIPFVALRSIRGLETHNFRHFVSSGLAADGKKVKQAVLKTIELLNNKNLAEDMIIRQKAINPIAADDIAKAVLKKGNIYVLDNNDCD